MKFIFLSILIAVFAVKSYAQENTVTEALLGNNPRATLTTGIGQVIQPVGIPVVQAPAASFLRPPPPPAFETPEQISKKAEKKEANKYKLPEISKKTASKKKETAFVDQPVVMSGGYYDPKAQPPPPPGKIKRGQISIPYSDPPPDIRIPYVD
ncbi:MAG: hypothetical protein Q7T03_00420 [Deltaproteobacteria bacterium]|nr:hypothetical protein [Deltaproteobacteria bacterium]